MSKKHPESSKTPQTQSAPVFLPPLKPRPKLFWGLLIGFFVWMIFLWTLWFTTRHT